ncbi:MAG: chromate transporter [Variovorax sp.]
MSARPDGPVPALAPLSDAAPTRPAPASPKALFLAFTWLALQGFGGVMAIIQREIVERKRWLSPDEFLEDWAVAQVLPGPNVVNMALMIGDRHFGLRGALAAVGGLLALPLCVVMAAALLYSRFGADPHVAGALRGMGAVAGGLIAATGFKLAAQLRRHPLGFPASLALVAVAFICIAMLHWPLLWVLLLVGGGACCWTWQRIAPAV